MITVAQPRRHSPAIRIPELAKRVAHQLRIDLGSADVDRFSDGEVRVEIHENVRGRDVFMLQSTCAPTNDNLMELMVMADAIKRASASRITAVMPYFGYARQDRRPRSARVPISAKVVADMLAVAGVESCADGRSARRSDTGFLQRAGRQRVRVAVARRPRARAALRRTRSSISPDVGGVVRARAIAKLIHDTDLAIIDKRRSVANESEVMNVIGDVEGRTCIIVDDIVDTAGTLCQAAAALKDRGAAGVVAYITHPVLSGPAVERINDSALDSMFVTDTIPLSAAGEERARGSPN